MSDQIGLIAGGAVSNELGNIEIIESGNSLVELADVAVALDEYMEEYRWAWVDDPCRAECLTACELKSKQQLLCPKFLKEALSYAIKRVDSYVLQTQYPNWCVDFGDPQCVIYDDCYNGRGGVGGEIRQVDEDTYQAKAIDIWSGEGEYTSETATFSSFDEAVSWVKERCYGFHRNDSQNIL